MALDKIDIRIIEHLQRNGRTSLRQLAEDLDLSPSTVGNHFHALTDEGVIKGFKPILDYEKVGLSLTAVIELKVETAKMEDVAAAMRGKNRVLFFYEVTGGSDMVMVCKFRDREDMNGFVKEMQKEEGVRETDTKVVLTEPKEYEDLDLQEILG